MRTLKNLMGNLKNNFLKPTLRIYARDRHKNTEVCTHLPLTAKYIRGHSDFLKYNHGDVLHLSPGKEIICQLKLQPLGCPLSYADTHGLAE